MSSSVVFETATFGGGCFWCTEAVFQRLAGVQSVVSGYAGGTVENPTYEAVCTGQTGHAEVVQVTFDPEAITFVELLAVFWHTHDPTSLNRQGNDIGTQYRSVIFYHDTGQRETAEMLKRELDATGEFAGPIVTQISPFTSFYPAEAYHQDYYNANAAAPYCQVMIGPKLKKLRERFGDKIG